MSTLEKLSFFSKATKKNAENVSKWRKIQNIFDNFMTIPRLFTKHSRVIRGHSRYAAGYLKLKSSLLYKVHSSERIVFPLLLNSRIKRPLGKASKKKPIGFP